MAVNVVIGLAAVPVHNAVDEAPKELKSGMVLTVVLVDAIAEHPNASTTVNE